MTPAIVIVGRCVLSNEACYQLLPKNVIYTIPSVLSIAACKALCTALYANIKQTQSDKCEKTGS